VLAPDGPIEHRVRAVEWLGHECLVFGSVGPSPVVVRQTGMASVDAGSTARVTCDPAQVHLFNPDTTERLT
jgi:ABC-type sugar transport system ATPase subunit